MNRERTCVRCSNESILWATWHLARKVTFDFTQTSQKPRDNLCTFSVRSFLSSQCSLLDFCLSATRPFPRCTHDHPPRGASCQEANFIVGGIPSNRCFGWIRQTLGAMCVRGGGAHQRFALEEANFLADHPTDPQNWVVGVWWEGGA